jgi:transcriptional regulator with XRE-family HTH domain
MNTNQDIMKKLEKISGKKLTLNNLLASIREGEDLSQVAFAKQLGVSRQFICDLEHDRRSLSPKMAREFARRLGYSESQFIRLCLQDLIQSDGLDYEVQLLSYRGPGSENRAIL